MPSPPTCPVCAARIDARVARLVRAFRCPACDELLRERWPIPGFAAATIIVSAITLALLEGVIGVIGWLLALIALPFAVVLIQAALGHVFGYTLEPATENGRVPLGGSGE